MKTIITYEEWYQMEGKRRRERPYTAETSFRHVHKCQKHNKEYRDCWQCRKIDSMFAFYDKAIITRTPYQYSFDNPNTLNDSPT